MNKYLAVLNSDAKNTFRDPSLIMILCVPILIILILRFGFPVLLDYLPNAIDYNKEIVCFLALLCAVFPGMIMSFILLDEKDIQLFPVMKVTPVSLSGFILTRIFVITTLGFLMSTFILLFNGIYPVEIIRTLQFSVLAGLNSPILVLIISHFAKNKIEGLTLLKVSNIILVIPFIVFFFDAKWEYAFGVFPAFWPYKMFDIQNYSLFFFLGLFVLSCFNYLIFRFVVKNN